MSKVPMSITIKNIRSMTKKEMKREGWNNSTTVIELTDGTLLYASRDEEGNAAGCLFGVTPDGKSFSFGKDFLFGKEYEI